MFRDTEKHWAKSDVERAAQLGLLEGYPDGSFRPYNPITRAEAAVIALRLYDSTEDTFEDLVAQVEPAVVVVGNLETGALGSGSSIGRGFVLTNNHVVVGGTRCSIQWTAWGYGPEGTAQYAEGPVVFAAPEIDLAIVRVDIPPYRESMPVLPLGNPVTVRKGMPVLVVGAPFGFAGTVSQGIVSFVGRRLAYQQSSGQAVDISDAIQTDAPINRGNSGGALVDRRGQLVGVPSVKLTGDGAEGLGFAIGLKTVGEAIARAKEAGVLVAAHQRDLVAALADQGLAVA